MTHPTVSAIASPTSPSISPPTAPPTAPPASGVPVHMRRDRFVPAEELTRLPLEAPVTRTEVIIDIVPLPAWLVTRYEDVREVLGDSTRFSNATQPLRDRAVELAGSQSMTTAGMLLQLDPPEHTRLRRMLTGQFTVRRMAQLRPRVEEIVTAQLDEMRREHAAGGPVDLVRAFALPIPSLVICELLGVPYADRDDFQRFSNVQIDMARPFAERMAAIAESHRYMARLVASQRQAPGDDLIGMLIREHGDDLMDDELVGLAALLLLAGHETTANMLALGTVLLLRNPGQLAALRDGTVPVDEAVEELLRYLTIVHATVMRVATTDVTLGGQTIRAGEGLVCSLPLANLDPTLGDDLDHLDLARTPPPHVAFGHGVHHCLGAPLARMEMQLAFPALLRAFPSLRLAVPFDELQFRAASFVHGIESVPVTW